MLLCGREISLCVFNHNCAFKITTMRFYQILLNLKYFEIRVYEKFDAWMMMHETT